MNFKEYDNKILWKYKGDLLKITKALGYQYISEAIICEYKKFQSCRLAGEVFEKSRSWVRIHLINLGADIQGKGGDTTKFMTKKRNKVLNQVRHFNNKTKQINY